MKRKNSNKNQILLSITALLVILLLSAGITYSWIEGGTTYTIQTADDGDVKTGKKPDTTVNTDLVINPDSATSIDLKKFDKNTTEEGLYFSPVSSADGENFYFPTSFDEDGKPTAYRKSNTNDIGTKYINYSFEVSASKKCYLAFDGKPTFTLTKNGTTLDSSYASAFRIMIKSGEETKFLTMQDSEVTSTVVTDENGTEDVLTAEPVNNYIYNLNHTNKLFKYDQSETETIEVSIWLDGDIASSDLRGGDVKVDLKLKAVQEKFKVSFDAVTYDNKGTVIADTAFTGGSIKVDTATYSQPFINEYVEGDTFTATAISKEDYIFGGWYSDEACSVRVTEENVMTSIVNGNAQYFAKYTEKPKYTVNAEVKTTPAEKTGGTVTVNGSGTTVTDYQDSTVTLKATNNTGYRFDGWYTDSECTTPLNSTYTNAEQTVTIGTSDATYYAKFVEQCTIDFIAMTNGSQSSKGGTVKINTDTADASVSKTVDTGTTITLTATPSSYAVCNGIYDANEAQKTNLVSYTFTATESATYYAYFEIKAVDITFSAVTGSTVDNFDGGSIEVNSTTYNEKQTLKFDIGAEIKATAKEKEGYVFDGWYTDADCSQSVDSNDGELTVTASTGTTTYYAKFVINARTVYLKPSNDWTNNSARFAVYVWNDAGNQWIDMSDDDGDGIYSAQVPNNYSNIIFVRMKGSSTTNSWNDKLGQTGDLTIPTDGKNQYNISDSKWVVFGEDAPIDTITIYLTNNKNWSNVYCCYGGGSSPTGWPGIAMTKDSTNGYNEDIYKIEIPSNSTSIIFNDGNGEQTVEITGFSDKSAYYLGNSKTDEKWPVMEWNYSG